MDGFWGVTGDRINPPTSSTNIITISINSSDCLINCLFLVTDKKYFSQHPLHPTHHVCGTIYVKITNFCTSRFQSLQDYFCQGGSKNKFKLINISSHCHVTHSSVFNLKNFNESKKLILLPTRNTLFSYPDVSIICISSMTYIL